MGPFLISIKPNDSILGENMRINEGAPFVFWCSVVDDRNDIDNILKKYMGKVIYFGIENSTFFIDANNISKFSIKPFPKDSWFELESVIPALRDLICTDEEVKFLNDNDLYYARHPEQITRLSKKDIDVLRFFNAYHKDSLTFEIDDDYFRFNSPRFRDVKKELIPLKNKCLFKLKQPYFSALDKTLHAVIDLFNSSHHVVIELDKKIDKTRLYYETNMQEKLIKYLNETFHNKREIWAYENVKSSPDIVAILHFTDKTKANVLLNREKVELRLAFKKRLDNLEKKVTFNFKNLDETNFYDYLQRLEE